MSLLDAKEYDPRPAQRMWRLIGLAAALVVALLAVLWVFRYWPEKSVVNSFFTAIERKDFETAYGIYNADPNWKQHADKYNGYPLAQFVLDWGPSSEFGVITSHKIDCAKQPDRGSGVIVMVLVNNRAQGTSMWVEKKTKTLTSPAPRELDCHPGR